MSKFLKIETKEDSAQRLASLAGLPSKFTYSADEWNLIRNKINDLYRMLQDSGATTVFENNVEVVEHNLPGLTSSHTISNVAAKINSLSPFTVSENELRIFKTFRTVTNGNGTGIAKSGSSRYDVVVERWLLKPGKGDYGNGKTPLKSTDLLYLNALTSKGRGTLLFDLGEIGSTSIEDGINPAGPFAVGNGNVVVFTCTRSGTEHDYLWLVKTETIGTGNLPTTATDFLHLNGVSPVSIPDVKDYVTHSFLLDFVNSIPTHHSTHYQFQTGDSQTFDVGVTVHEFLGVYVNGQRLAPFQFNETGSTVEILDILDNFDKITINFLKK